MTTSAAMPDQPPPSLGQWLRTQRQARGWSIPEMRRHLREAARLAGDTLPGNECLGVMIRRWERDDGGVSERYRMHFSTAFGIPLTDFGTAPLPGNPGPAAAELARLRGQYADLAARHRKFRRELIAWMLAMHQDLDPDVTSCQTEGEL